MKKQYLISLLGITAISISLGNSFSSVFSSPSNSINENSSPTTPNIKDEVPDDNFNYSIEQVSTGATHSAAIVNDGTNDHLYTWGANIYGQLGLGIDDWDDHNNPQEVIFPGAEDIEQISMGDNYSAAIVDDDLYTWGENNDGQLGLGDEFNEDMYTTPQEVTAFNGDNVDQVSLGINSSAAVANGDLYTWGNTYQNQLGLGDEFTEDIYNTPQEVTSLSAKGDVEQLSLGYHDGGVVISDVLYTWGYNSFNQLGHESQIKEPQAVTGLPTGDITQISMGGNHSGAIVDDKLYTWGRNTEGELGLEDNEVYNTPQEVKILSDVGDVEQISMGRTNDGQQGFSAAVVNDGSNDHLYTWGDNSKGQLGYVTSDQHNNPTPKEVGGLPAGDIKQVSGGKNYTGAIINDGSQDYLYTWGDNYKDKLGLSDEFTDDNYNTPNKVWETPYVDAINSTSEAIGDSVGAVQINYDFETNVDVQSVDVTVFPTDDPENKVTENSKLDLSTEGKYNGTETFHNIVPKVEYTYTISLNYKTYNGEDKTALIDQGTFCEDETEPSKIIATNGGKATVEGTNSASVGYEVTPGENAYGHILTVTNVQWIDNTSGKEIASSVDTEGTLNATELVPNTLYDNTTIIATMSDGSITSEVKIDSFTTESYPVEKSTIKEVGVVNVTSSTEANVNYEIIAGNDAFGNISTAEEVKWIDSKGNELANNNDGNLTGTLSATGLKPNVEYIDTKIVATMSGGEEIIDDLIEAFTLEAGNEPSSIQAGKIHDIGQTTASLNYVVTPGLDVWGVATTTKNVQWIDNDGNVIATDDLTNGIDGTLIADDLEINTAYKNTTVVATMSDDSTTNIVPIKEFSTDKGTVQSTLAQGEEGLKVTGPTSATIDYVVIPGKNDDGEDLTVTNVQWMNGPNDELASSTSASGTLEANDLEINTAYNNTTLVAEMSDGTKTNIVAVQSFKTDEGTTESTLEVDQAVAIKSPTAATIGYEVTAGTDEDGKSLTTQKVQWINNDTDDEIAQDVVNQYNGIDGTLEANKLAINTTYSNTSVIATMSDGTKTAIVPVNEFMTDAKNEEDPIMKVEYADATDTTASFNYGAINGQDASGSNYELTGIMISDNQGNVLYEDTAVEGLALNGSFTVEDLTANTIYDDWTMTSTFVNTGNEDKEQKEFNKIESFTTLYSKPVVAEPMSMQVDETNGTLEVKGTISTNDAEIIAVNILKDKKDVTTTSSLSNSFDNKETTYDVLTIDYDNSANYELQVIYSSAEGANLPLEPYLLDPADFSYNNSINLNSWIIIGVLVFSCFSLLVGFSWFRHYRKENKEV